jgi:monoamine oxidase
VYFETEHTEPISRSGSPNGAVRSGERAALQVLDLQRL